MQPGWWSRIRVLARQIPEAVAAATAVVDRMAFGARANAEARRKFAGRYLLNTLRNLGVIGRSGDVGALVGAFRGVPGVVVSAGPSLDENIRDLRALAGRTVIIAVDTSLRPLLLAGIQPHLVVAVDPSETNGRHLRDLPDTGRTHLVAEGSLDPAAFDAFADRVFTFKVSDHEPWPWFRSHGLDRALLRAWGSVATSAFDLALNLGCDPIVFAGQDLAYTGGRPYCRGTTFEIDWATAVANGSTLPGLWAGWPSMQSAKPAPDIHGRPTPTTPALLAFRDWLTEQCARRTDRRFINATGAGVLLGPHLEQASLITAIPLAVPPFDAFATLACARKATPRGGGRVPAAARTMATSIGAGEPVHQVDVWRQFAAGTVSPDDLRAALEPPVADTRSGCAAVTRVTLTPQLLTQLAGTSTLRPRRRLPSTSRPPERVAAIRAIATGTDMPTWTLDTPRPTLPGEPAFLRAVLHEATAALCRLFALPDLVGGLLPGQESLVGSLADSLSLTASFDWSPAARSDVDVVERCVRIVSGFVDERSEQSPLDAFRWTVLSATPPQTSDATSLCLSMPREALRWWARRALLVEWTNVLKAIPEATTDADAGRTAHLGEWLRALSDASAPAGLDQASAVVAGSMAEATGLAASAPTAFRFDLSTPLWRLMRALTGAVVRVRDPADPDNDSAAEPDEWSPLVDVAPEEGDRRGVRIRAALEANQAGAGGPADPRVRFLRRRDAFVQPRVLALPGSYTAGQVDASVAFVTPYLERCSRTVNATGEVQALAEWPNPIVGEHRGPGTGGVAWSNAGPWYLMRRAEADGPVETVVAPFRPARAAVVDDGTSVLERDDWWPLALEPRRHSRSARRYAAGRRPHGERRRRASRPGRDRRDGPTEPLPAARRMVLASRHRHARPGGPRSARTDMAARRVRRRVGGGPPGRRHRPGRGRPRPKLRPGVRLARGRRVGGRLARGRHRTRRCPAVRGSQTTDWLTSPGHPVGKTTQVAV